MHRRPVANELADISAATSWADNLVTQAALSDDIRFNIEVCLEEALANLIQHGRAPDGVKHIAVLFSADGEGATITITDRCEPYDVTRAEAPHRPNIDDMHVGGQGLRLMRAFSSEISYQADADGNALTMRFRSPA